MTSEALTELWELSQRTQRHELEFWKKAEEALNNGLCTIEDIGTIYGIHPQTARKRLAALHFRRQPNDSYRLEHVPSWDNRSPKNQ